MAGLAYPPVGACVRARWAAALGESSALHTAYSLEAVVDEAIFMFGPVLVTVLATSVNETLGVVVVIVFALVGGAWLASMRGIRAARAPASTAIAGAGAVDGLGLAADAGARRGVPRHPVRLHRGRHGRLRPGAGTSRPRRCPARRVGLRQPDRRRHHRQRSSGGRARCAAIASARLAMACVMLPLPFVGSIPLLAVVLFLAGFAISPTLVALRLARPAARPGIAADRGHHLGHDRGRARDRARCRGRRRLIDAYGASAAYVVPVVGGVLAAVVAALTPDRHGAAASTDAQVGDAEGRAETGPPGRTTRWPRRSVRTSPTHPADLLAHLRKGRNRLTRPTSLIAGVEWVPAAARCLGSGTASGQTWPKFWNRSGEEMQRLKLVGLSADGRQVVLVDDTGAEFATPADDRLRAALRGDRARLGQLEIEMDSALRPRDIQARIRAGDSPETVAGLAQVSVDRIMPYAVPVLAERAAHRRAGPSQPRPPQGRRRAVSCVGRRGRRAAAGRGVDALAAEWDAWRREDGRWAVQASYHSGRARAHRAVHLRLRWAATRWPTTTRPSG